MADPSSTLTLKIDTTSVDDLQSKLDKMLATVKELRALGVDIKEPPFGVEVIDDD